jgi:glutaredoxin 3
MISNLTKLMENFVTGGSTVPRIFIGGKFVGGCDEVTKLHSSGKLREMLGAVGAC